MTEKLYFKLHAENQLLKVQLMTHASSHMNTLIKVTLKCRQPESSSSRSIFLHYLKNRKNVL